MNTPRPISPARPPAPKSIQWATCVVVAGVLQGCVMVPRTTQVYDAECGVMVRQMELEAVQVASLVGCSGRECGVLLAAAGATAAASAVISGSIVVAGNVAYWFEKQGHCLRLPADGGRGPVHSNQGLPGGRSSISP